MPYGTIGEKIGVDVTPNFVLEGHFIGCKKPSRGGVPYCIKAECGSSKLTFTVVYSNSFESFTSHDTHRVYTSFMQKISWDNIYQISGILFNSIIPKLSEVK